MGHIVGLKSQYMYIPYCPQQVPPHLSKHPPPILTVLWFFDVLCVAAHHAKFWGWAHIAVIAFWMPQHQASKVCTHLSVASFAAIFPCSTIFAYCKRQLNGAETWQRGQLCSTIQLSPLSGWPRWSDDAVHPGSLLRIWGGPLHRDSV